MGGLGHTHIDQQGTPQMPRKNGCFENSTLTLNPDVDKCSYFPEVS